MESNRIDENSRVLLSTPLFHMNATAAGLLPCLSQGGSVVILKEFDADRVIDAIETHGCTYTTGVPATYKLILAAARQRTHVDASSLEFIAVGSAPMTRALLDELVQTLPGVDVIEGYGLTESGPIIKAAGLQGSMGRVAAAGDNAAMESFFSLLQKNVLDRHRGTTRAQLHAEIVYWIEHTYHRRRRQRALGKLTPIEYELAFGPDEAIDAA